MNDELKFSSDRCLLLECQRATREYICVGTFDDDPTYWKYLVNINRRGFVKFIVSLIISSYTTRDSMRLAICVW